MRDNFSKGSAGFGLPQFFLTVTKDPQNVFTQELNDAFGRTVASRSMDSAGGSEIIPSYKFDILDNTLKEISPAADTNPIDTSRYRYNTLGQMIREQTPDGGEFTYDYNNDGTLSNEMLWNKSGMYMGLEYSYDSLSRLIQIKRILVGKASVEVVRNYYDTVLYAGKSPFTSIPLSVFDEMSNLKGRLAATVGRNHLDGDIISVGKFYSYDEEGRISRKITAMSGSPIYQESRFEYDIHGKTVAEYFSYSGDRIKKKFIYDQMGRLARVIQCIYPDGADSCTDKELVRNEYDDLDKLTHKTFSAIMPGTYRTSNIFDIRDRLINLIPGGSKGFGEAIRYTPTGNIDSASYVYSLGSGMDTTFSCAYAYDNINRLVSAATNNGMTSTDNTYSYDAVGRFRSKKEGSSNLTGYKYFAANSRLRKTSKNPAAGQEYVYDAFGNLVVDFTKKMIIENDWRCQPVIYSFYNDLSTAGISRDSTGVYNGAIDLYTQMQNKVKAGAIAIVSKVKMIYDADGNRVCKMEAR
jgi:YD repeat-containing protein